jgi:RNA polymerase sigma factor (sigma-70 family)
MSQRRADTQGEVLLDSTAELLTKVKAGNRSAENEIARRNLPELRRWARGRLPASLRDRDDTEDIVQETLVRALRRLPMLEIPHGGAFQSYLRTALRHRVVDAVRRSQRRPTRTTIEDPADKGPDPHQIVIGNELAERYGLALEKLRPLDRALLKARIDRGWTYEQIRRAFGKTTVNATRVALTRALQRLAKAADFAPPEARVVPAPTSQSVRRKAPTSRARNRTAGPPRPPE